jgi:hypothetical protein
MPTVKPPTRTHRNIARGRRFSISSRSMASSFGFSAAVNASTKNSAFIASQPASLAVSGRPVTPRCRDAPEVTDQAKHQLPDGASPRPDEIPVLRPLNPGFNGEVGSSGQP